MKLSVKNGFLCVSTDSRRSFPSRWQCQNSAVDLSRTKASRRKRARARKRQSLGECVFIVVPWTWSVVNTCCDSSCRKSDLKLMGTENVIPFSSPRCYSPFWSLRPVVRFPFPHPEETPGLSDAPPPVWNLGPVVRFPIFFTLKRHQGCLMPHPLSGISGLWFDSPFLTLKAMFGRQSLIFLFTF